MRFGIQEVKPMARGKRMIDFLFKITVASAICCLFLAAYSLIGGI